MLDKNTVKRLSPTDLTQCLETFNIELDLTKRRLSRLIHKQEVNPLWEGYDPIIDEFVGIDIRIEEQEAVRDELEEQLKIIFNEHNRREGLNQTIRMF